MRPIANAATIELGSPPEEVWRFVADTDRTNRVVGARPVVYEAIERSVQSGPTSARFVARTSSGGLDLAYEELPFEWTYGRELRVVRRMRGGVLETFTLTWSLEPSAALVGGTTVNVKLELTPRHAWVAPAVWLQGRAIVGRVVAFVQSIDAHVRDRAPSPFEAAARGRVNEALLAAGVAALERSAVSRALALRLAAYLRDAGDADLVRIRPFELADALNEPRPEVLRALLHGVPAGLVDLRWAIVCPSCRTASELAASLDEVKPEGHCQLCDITFELELDRAVEATFTPHDAVRKVEPRMFCIGGPARTPHVMAQINVDPNEARSLAAPRAPGRYRIFARGGAAGSVEVEEGAEREARVTVGDAGVQPVETHVAPGGALHVTNATSEPRHVKVERLGYASDAATAHHLSTVEEFRRLFSSDLLKRGTPLKVTRVAILFSDLTGSTALYTKVGDAAAFRLVDDHFDVMRAAIGENDGVIVKTMGDAVMAAFRDPRSCVRAAVAALRGFEGFRATSEHGALVGLKLGAVVGPCYVVTANGALDYFGQTVNVASRVQHLAGSAEIVVPRELFDALEESEKGAVRVTESFEARVKGVDAPLQLVRLAVA